MNNDDQTVKNNNDNQSKLISNLPQIYTGQYLALSENDTLKVVQVQESNVADQNLLVEVDTENVVLNLNDNYDLLQSLVTTANSQQIDLSQLIINELTNYPQLQDQLTAANKSLADAQSKITELQSKITELQSDNQELQDEINKLNEKKQETTPTNPSTTDPSKNASGSSTPTSPTSPDSSKNDIQTGVSNTNDQVQAGSDKTPEKASDEVSDQSKNVGTNNEL